MRYLFFFNTKTYFYKENQQHFRFPDIGNIDSWASNKPVASSTTLVNVNSPMIGATNCTNFWQREPFLYSPSKGVRFDYSGIVMCTFWWIENCCSGRVKDVIMMLINITLDYQQINLVLNLKILLYFKINIINTTM